MRLAVRKHAARTGDGRHRPAAGAAAKRHRSEEEQDGNARGGEHAFMLNRTSRKEPPLSDADPSRPVRRIEPVIGEVIEDTPRAAQAPHAHAPRGTEPFLRSLHAFLLGLTTILLAVPAVLAVIAVTVIPIIVWLVVGALLRITFRLLALLTGARPEAVTTGAFLKAQVVRGVSRAWGRAG